MQQVMAKQVETGNLLLVEDDWQEVLSVLLHDDHVHVSTRDVSLLWNLWRCASQRGCWSSLTSATICL